MKKIVFFLACSLLFLFACDKIFWQVSGKEADLQGKWQMDDADTVYYNFQKSLFQYQIYRTKDVMSGVFGYYYLRGDTGIELRLLREYANFSLNHLGWDTLRSATGQDTICKEFKIEKFTKKQLILYSNNREMSFRKFE